MLEDVYQKTLMPARMYGAVDSWQSSWDDCAGFNLLSTGLCYKMCIAASWGGVSRSNSHCVFI